MNKNLKLFSFLFLALLVVGTGCLFLGSVPTINSVILFEVRLPRVFLGMMVGAALACVGAMFQSLLRNPLADPYVLGTSSGASLGALLGLQVKKWICFSSFLASSLTFYICIFLGAFGATVLSYLIARNKNQVSVNNLVLAGIIVSTLCGSIIMLIFSLAHQDSFTIFFFLMGSLMESSWNTILISSIVIILGLLSAFQYAKALDFLSLGEEKAMSLGVNVERLKYILFGLGALVVSASVALAGSIGFVGLVVPHLARLWVGSHNKILIPVSAFLGAIVLMLGDGLARTVFTPIELPVGILMTLLGAPFFLWLLKRKGKLEDLE